MTARIARGLRAFGCDNPLVALEAVLTNLNRTLERIDGRIERSDRRWEEEQRHWAERDRRWEAREEKRDLEWRQFTRETTLRNARMTQEMIAAIAAIETRVNDQREQIRANTEAVLRMLDERFGPERPQG